MRAGEAYSRGEPIKTKNKSSEISAEELNL
jgi:hypothetical protein